MIETLKYILNPQCRDTSFLNSQKEIFQVHPITVCVKPWQGRHNVYGIFMLPNEHKIRYPVMITVKEAGSYRKEAYMVKENIEEYPAPPGYYLLRVCLKTRVAIGMIFRGLYYQLKDPLNWIFTYTLITEDNKI